MVVCGWRERPPVGSPFSGTPPRELRGGRRRACCQGFVRDRIRIVAARAHGCREGAARAAVPRRVRLPCVEVRFCGTAPTAMSRCAPYRTRASLRPARPCDSKRCGSREDPTGSTAPGGVPAAATSGYGRSVTRAAERFRLVTAGGDDRGRGCDAEARAAPDAAIGPGRAGSWARAAGRARSVPTGCQEQCLGQKGVRSRLALRPDALPDLRTPYWICSASALPPSGSVMGLGAAGG